jgi:hypothetical protein
MKHRKEKEEMKESSSNRDTNAKNNERKKK